MCVPGCQDTIRRVLSRRRLLAGAAATLTVTAAPAEAAPRPWHRVLDLTHTLSAAFPTFDGRPGIALERAADLKTDGYNLYRWQLNEHSGTHLDAPIHFSADGASAEAIPADALVLPLSVIDASSKAANDPDYQLSRSDLADWERRHGRLPDNGCVAMHSGWARYVGEPTRYAGRDARGTMHFPGFAPDAVGWLIDERRAAGLAVDTLSLDHGASKDFKTHLLWLGSGRWGLENVAGLERVPAAGATLVVGLAKVAGATGGPARLFALI
ncbi:MAG: cyclase family protein [Hyphomicrobiales bacterium]|nr:cyclase family protein [Hyphomicrobiales bacterium]